MRLAASRGDFNFALMGCLVEDTPTAQASDPDRPGAGGLLFYLVRASSCGGGGSHDTSGARQAGPRDAEIAASPFACN
jgi:hypothetical protein